MVNNKVNIQRSIFFLCATFLSQVSWGLSSSKVQLSNATGPYFILDSNNPCTDGPTASYVGVKIINTYSSSIKNVVVRMDSIGTSNNRVVNMSDSSLSLGNILSGDSSTAFFYVKYPCSINTASTFYFSVSDDSTGTVSYSFTVTTISVISSNAGGLIVGRSTGISTLLGGIVSDTITYEMGNINKANDIVSISPNGDSLFDSKKLVLLSSKIISSQLPFIPVGTRDDLYFVLPSNNNTHPSAPQIKVVYTYVNKSTQYANPLLPFAYNKSGAQNKYTSNYGDTSGALAGYISIPAASNLQPLRITRSINTTINNACDTVTYTIDISNPTTERVQFNTLIDSLPNNFTFLGLTAASDIDSSNALSLPQSGATGIIHFIGGVYVDSIPPCYSFIVEPSDTLTVSYQVKISCSQTDTSAQVSKSILSIGGYHSSSDTSINCVGCSVAPLPVDLTYFEAQPSINHTAFLSWSTASEINNSHFEIERSYDGRVFETVGEVAGNGNSQHLIRYSYTDQAISPSENTAFYRLKQVDFDGAFEYSDIRVVRFDQIVEGMYLKAYPNPFFDEVILMVSLPQGEDYSLEITDLKGAIVHQSNHTFTSGVHTIHLSTRNKGVYVIEVVSKKGLEHVKVMKK